MRIAAAIALCLLLGACVAGDAVMQDATRGLARSAVDQAAARYVPGVDVSPYTDCVINNATTGELVQLAQAATAQDVAAQAWPVVRTVAQRPAATQCFVSALSGSQLLAAQGLALGDME